MQPPGSYNPYQQPAPNYQYPDPYSGQYPGQYPPQYQYPYYGPPPKKPMSRTVIIVIVVVVALAVLIPIVLAGVLVVWMQTIPSGGGDVETTLGLRVFKGAGGDWQIDVTSGFKSASSVRLQVINPSTGTTTVSKMVSALAPAYSDPDAVYYDTNGNGRLDAGDTFQLKSSGGHISAGYKVQLLVGESIVGSIKELPA